jgi:hypothetical protein
MISSKGLANTVLNGLDTLGIPWCLMHGESRLHLDRLASDLDVAVADDPMTVVRGLRPALNRAGLYLVCLWNYDPWSWTSFWMTTAGEVVQLDLTYDPQGRNKYGLKTDAMVLARVPGYRWPRAAELDEKLYLLAKRLYKGQEEEAASLVATVSKLDWLGRSRWLFESKTADRLSGAVSSGVVGRQRVRRRPQLRRLMRRLTKPSGHCVRVSSTAHGVSDDLMANRISEHLIGRLPHVEVTQRALGVRSRVLRMRPGVVLTSRGGHGADAVIHVGSSPDGIEQLVLEMSAATAARFALDR